MMQKQGKGIFARGEFSPRRGVGVPGSIQAEGCHHQASDTDRVLLAALQVDWEGRGLNTKPPTS